MKLNGREAARFCAEPDRSMLAALIHGEDQVEVSARARRLVAALSDGGGDCARIGGAEVRRDPAVLLDAMKSRSFFGGDAAVLVEGATDGCLKGISEALEAAGADDAFLAVTAGALPARSKLRAFFEKGRNIVAAPVYGDAPDRGMVIDMLRAAGAPPATDDAVAELGALGATVGTAGLRDLVARLALYRLDDGGPIEAGDVDACAPGAADAAVDELAELVADGSAKRIGPVLARLRGRGASPTEAALAASRHFRRIHAALAEAEGGGSLDAAIGRLRPPVFGPRKDRLLRQCRGWGLAGAEGALSHLLETDRALRGGSAAAGYALLERALLRLALSVRR